MNASFVGRTFAAAVWITLVVVGTALAHAHTLSAVVAHKDEDGVLSHFGLRFEEVHYLSKAFVHTFNQGGMVNLLLVEIGLQLLVVNALAVGLPIVRDEARVGIVGGVDGIVRHVKIERPVGGDGHGHGFQGLLRECIGEERTFGIVFLKTGHMGKAGAVVVLCQIAGGRSVGTAGNVHIEAESERILAGCTDGAPVGFSAMDGVVAVVLEELRKSGG